MGGPNEIRSALAGRDVRSRQEGRSQKPVRSRSELSNYITPCSGEFRVVCSRRQSTEVQLHEADDDGMCSW